MLATTLGGLLAVQEGRLAIEIPGSSGVDAIIRGVDHTFMVAVKTKASTAAIRDAVERLRGHTGRAEERTLALVAVPYMGEVGKKICMENGVNWLDFSGNGRIQGKGLRVNVHGYPNRYKQSGRPENVFAPRSSRIARWLLVHWPKRFAQRELASLAGIGEGFASRIVRRMAEQGYVDRQEGSVGLTDPGLVLDAWRESYGFSKHRILRGRVATRTSEAMVTDVASGLFELGVKYAQTGLGAAWLHAPFAGYNTATFYVARSPSDEVKSRLKFHEGDLGANIWLVVPNDDGVFHGARPVAGIVCVDPVQVYLDLKAQPERSTEAAEALKAKVLHSRWSSSG